jgi:hypothetical protein
MIKNLIIIALVVLLMTKTNVTINEVLEYIQLGLDKAQQLVYNIKSEVK